jgi:glutamate-1-semialdehyde 2,1-aminomutase
MSSDVKNQEWYDRAMKVMPGGQSNLRMPLGVKPLFIERGKGAHLWDVDGNEYIDYMCGAGPGIFGYSNEEYLHALKHQLYKLYYLVSGAVQSTLEVEVAEKIVELTACAENVRFVLSGTEAVQLAIRLARAYTKRPYFIRFEGHYHGWLDNVLGGIVNDRATGKPFAIESDQDPVATEGRAPGALEESFKLPWNDVETLETVLEKYGHDVAMIHMEPILCNGGCCPPRPGYLERVRELCTRNGIVLSFDEVITGFRVSLRSAQGLLGVTPDLATFGKAVAGGVPMGAVAGKNEILDLLLQKRVIGAGTFNGYPYGMAAAMTTLSLLEKDEGAHYRKIDALQGRLMSGLKEIAKRMGIPVLIQGPRGVFFFQFIDREIAYSVRDLKDGDVAKQNRFRMMLAAEGILIMWGGRWYVSSGLTEEDINVTLGKVERVLKRL